VGNFDIGPLAAALDFARIALAPVVTSANERMVKLLQAPFSGLAAGLAARLATPDDALSELATSGQAITVEARTLATRSSYELASSVKGEGIEDRATMAPLSARRLADMVSLCAGSRPSSWSSPPRPSTCEPSRANSAWAPAGPTRRFASWSRSPRPTARCPPTWSRWSSWSPAVTCTPIPRARGNLRPPSRGRLPQIVEATEGAFKRVGEPLAVTGRQQVKHQAGERGLYQRRLAFGVLGA